MLISSKINKEVIIMPDDDDVKLKAAADKAAAEELVRVEAEKNNAGELIGKANEAAERLEDANKELGKLLAQQEGMKVEETLGGTASAGTPQKSKDEISEDSAKKMLVGTGLEDYAFPKKDPI